MFYIKDEETVSHIVCECLMMSDVLSIFRREHIVISNMAMVGIYVLVHYLETYLRSEVDT